jgi:hypothetical protein
MSSNVSRVTLLSIFRALLMGVMVLLADYFLEFGTSRVLLVAAGALGSILGTVVALSRCTPLGAVVLTAGSFLVAQYGLPLIELLAHDTFLSTVATMHARLLFLLGGIAAWSTWAFWRYEITATLEACAIGFTAIGVLAGHRGYRFDLPRLITTLAWDLGTTPLTVIVGLGLFTFLAMAFYLAVAWTPLTLQGGIVTSRAHEKHGIRSLRDTVLFCAVILCVLGAVATELYRFYGEQAEARTANGVGQDNQEGLTPLTFQSALGSTNQPAALLRLDGDYKENPTIPMLYLREGVLSRFGGSEMIIGPSHYDREVSRDPIAQGFSATVDSSLIERVEVVQSVYLLADHKMPFSIDYPRSIRPLKNPQPERFKGAFRVTSLAPTIALSRFGDFGIGNPAWTPEDLAYYTTTHPDPRYHTLALQITAAQQTPLLKARAIIEYLNREAIYTLTPNHEIKQGEDKVASFLFGDKRGYCVHFAHSMVYLFRSLGIPSRIGTGYLTDLSQARDGHVLLRMSDRHAWAEIYITSVGWVPFDVQPERVESHADSEVDKKLLEELMGMIGPDEELLPDRLTENEERVQEEQSSTTWSAELRAAFWSLPLLLIVMVVALRYLYLIPGSQRWLLITSIVAVSARLVGRGYHRRYGESLRDYIAQSVSLNDASRALIELVEQAQYHPDNVKGLTRAAIHKARAQLIEQIAHQDLNRSRRWYNQFRGICSPVPFFSLLRGRLW